MFHGRTVISARPLKQSERVETFHVLDFSQNIVVRYHFCLNVCRSDVRITWIRKCQVQIFYCMQNGSAYSANIGCSNINFYTTVLVGFYQHLLWIFSTPIHSPVLVAMSSTKLLLWVFPFFIIFLFFVLKTISYTPLNFQFPMWNTFLVQDYYTSWALH